MGNRSYWVKDIFLKNLLGPYGLLLSAQLQRVHVIRAVLKTARIAKGWFYLIITHLLAEGV